MGEGEILRLWANVWLSPAVSPGGRAGCRLCRILQRPGYPTPARARRRFYTDLDKCPKPYKIAAPARARSTLALSEF